MTISELQSKSLETYEYFKKLQTYAKKEFLVKGLLSLALLVAGIAFIVFLGNSLGATGAALIIIAAMGIRHYSLNYQNVTKILQGMKDYQPIPQIQQSFDKIRSY